MTYTIIAHCARTGRIGICTTTTSLACGRRNESVRANVGISKSQAMYVRAHDPRALNLLELGYTPQSVLRVVEANDEDFDFRQTGIIDREGNVVAHTGRSCGPWAGHKTGPGYAAFGNGLAGPQVIEGIIAGFLSNLEVPLEDRLLNGIEGGARAGGQVFKGSHRAESSAWLRIVNRRDFPEIDLRVDVHDDAVPELRRIFTEFKLYRDYYRDRSMNPKDAMPEEEFVAQLSVRS
jgi:uncharacterized Ntn-hydrolase superfamily protein